MLMLKHYLILLIAVAFRKLAALHSFANRQVYVKMSGNNAAPIQHDAIRRISVSLPSGLHFVSASKAIKSAHDQNVKISHEDCLHHVCLLYHDIVKLRLQNRQVHVFPSLFPVKLCETTIIDAEVFAADNGGWNRNSASCGMEHMRLDDIYGPFSSVHGLIVGEILPLIAEKFGVLENQLRLGAAFIAKYECSPGKISGLGKHRDASSWSFVMTLNQPDKEFTGGGTKFFELDQQSTQSGTLFRPKGVGSLVLFSGRHLHEGVAISSGVRYILLGFCSSFTVSDPHSHFMGDYCPDADGLAAAAGVRTGDILKGIHLPDYREDDANNLEWADRRFLRDGIQYISTENMTTETLQSLLQLHTSSTSSVVDHTRSIDILVQRTEIEESCIDSSSSLSNYVIGHSGDIFSKGLYWSMDVALDGAASTTF